MLKVAIAVEPPLQVRDPVLPAIRVGFPLLVANSVGIEAVLGLHLAENDVVLPHGLIEHHREVAAEVVAVHLREKRPT